MPTYELSFEIEPASDAVEERLVSELDAIVAVHSGVTTVTLEFGGDDYVIAARAAANALREVGAEVVRVVADLVTRRDIATRLGVTPQAVGLWVRGERHGDGVFPAPYVTGSVVLWLWGEVAEYCRALGVCVDDGVSFPTRRELHRVAGELAAA